MLHFQRRGSQLLDSSTKTCERKERKKKQLTSTKNRTKTASKEKTEKTLGNYSLYRDLKQNAISLFAFHEFFLLWFLSIIDTLLPRARSLSFFKLLDRHKLRHYARIFRKILPKWHDSILSSG